MTRNEPWRSCCKKAGKAPNRPIAIAIVDDQGELVSYARMDKCAPQPPIIARKKAYTAARTRSDTLAYAERLKGQGRSVTEFGDPNLIAPTGRGGDHQPGRSERAWWHWGKRPAAEEDEALAKMGLKAIVG